MRSIPGLAHRRRRAVHQHQLTYVHDERTAARDNRAYPRYVITTTQGAHCNHSALSHKTP
jgi:hypothetical protein